MNFKDLLIRAKESDATALNEIVSMYKPLLIKTSILNGIIDEDLYQELCLTLLKCIKKIDV